MALILVVEEDRPLADLLVLSLERFGHTVKATYRASEALGLIAEVKPDLVLIDIFLTGINGLDLLRTLKMNGDLEKLNVIMLSSYGFKEVVQQAMLLGAGDFIVKPVDVDALAQKIERVLLGT
jgi:CheY-like chemotaxis protein